GLNIKTNQITCAIGSIDEKGTVHVRGTGTSKAKGIEKGVISNLSEVAYSITNAVEKAESAARTKVVSLIANCDGPNIRSYNARGNATISDKENEVTKRDIERVIQAAKTIALPFDRQIISPIIRGFILDGQDSIKDPTGMYGTRLEVDMQIVAGLISNIQNISKAINTAGFGIEDIVLSGIAAGGAALEELEKDLGVVLIYISYSSTHIVVYNAGEIKSVEVLAMGRGDFVDAISFNFRIPHEYAEDIIERNANLDRASVTEGEKIILRVGGVQRSMSKAAIFNAIEPKVKEFIFDIRKSIKNMPFAKEIASGCVVTGELTNLSGFLEMLEVSLNMPVRMGFAKGFLGDADIINNTAYIVCLGLLKHWSREGLKRKVKRNVFGSSPIGKLFNRAKDIFNDYF
ncbi:MAG: hypothetical protein AMJ78_02685, partial [Omnitrophica WOR_2 bacterium SM23_29]